MKRKKRKRKTVGFMADFFKNIEQNQTKQKTSTITKKSNGIEIIDYDLSKTIMIEDFIAWPCTSKLNSDDEYFKEMAYDVIEKNQYCLQGYHVGKAIIKREVKVQPELFVKLTNEYMTSNKLWAKMGGVILLEKDRKRLGLPDKRVIDMTNAQAKLFWENATTTVIKLINAEDGDVRYLAPDGWSYARDVGYKLNQTFKLTLESYVKQYREEKQKKATKKEKEISAKRKEYDKKYYEKYRMDIEPELLIRKTKNYVDTIKNIFSKFQPVVRFNEKTGETYVDNHKWKINDLGDWKGWLENWVNRSTVNLYHNGHGYYKFAPSKTYYGFTQYMFGPVFKGGKKQKEVRKGHAVATDIEETKYKKAVEKTIADDKAGKLKKDDILWVRRSVYGSNKVKYYPWLITGISHYRNTGEPYYILHKLGITGKVKGKKLSSFNPNNTVIISQGDMDKRMYTNFKPELALSKYFDPEII